MRIKAELELRSFYPSELEAANCPQCGRPLNIDNDAGNELHAKFDWI